VNVDPVVKPIRLSAHAHENMCSRGATEREVVEAIRRLECRQDFAYGQNWNDKFYTTKQVSPIS
jgi:hypothetical protein